MMASDKNKLLVREVRRAIPWCVLIAALIYLSTGFNPPGASDLFNEFEFSKLPVSYRGRVKPIDTVARNTLTIISNRQSLKHEQERITPGRWLLDTLAKPQHAEEYEVFRIDHPEVLAIFGFDQTVRKRFSAKEIRTDSADFVRQAQLVEMVPQKQRNVYQRKVNELVNHLSIYEGIASYRDLFMVPPVSRDTDWMPIPQAIEHARQTGSPPPGAMAWAAMLKAYHENAHETFNKTLTELQSDLAFHQPVAVKKAGLEVLLNRYAPFAKARVLYVVAALLIFISWLGLSQAMRKAALAIVIAALVVHTLGLVARIYLSGRPPVTNLYSAAVFIGWAMVGLGVILEKLYRNGMPILLSATAGFLTLLVAAALSNDGDTMAVLVAVLDTNFWLATHVVAITIGYSATYLAGLIGIAYILRGLLTTSMTQEDSRRIGQMLYGTICFAMFFSFVGTILGGIWADQSWGRFWGWDPKENGAVLIVLWNALILHARWSGMAKQRGMAAMAVFGNIITTWSFFGTNMLGVGLHAYGFIESAVWWLFIFVISQLLLINLAAHPTTCWSSRFFAVGEPSPATLPTMLRLFAHGSGSGLLVVMLAACVYYAMPPTIIRPLAAAATGLLATGLCGYAGVCAWKQNGAVANLAGVPAGACVYFLLAGFVVDNVFRH